MVDGEAAFAGHFSLSVTAALRDQLIAKLETLDRVQLAPESLDFLANAGGVYQLFDGDFLVYVGKSAKDLPGRLAKHWRKISGRQGGLQERVSFRCLYVDEDLDAMAPEKMLIGRYRNDGAAEWNNMGFGNNDPGKRRDTTLVEERNFDRQYPIDLSVTVAIPSAQSSGRKSATKPITSLAYVMRVFKEQLPYNFRYQRKEGWEARLKTIDLSDDFPDTVVKTARQWLEWIVERLPETWTVVALPGYVIAYPNFEASLCGSRTGAWSRVGASVVYKEHSPVFSNEEVPDDENLPSEYAED